MAPESEHNQYTFRDLFMDTIAVLIPCFNEAQTIAKVVHDFKTHLPEATIYVYDNNSRDDTALLAAKAGAIVRHEPRQGKGNVVRSMLRDIDARCYIMVDGDDTYPAEYARALCDPILRGECDMVIGDRLSSTYFTENKRPFHNSGNVIVRRFIRSLWNRQGGRDINDVMTGMRALSPLFAKAYPVMSPGFELETELTIFALENRFRIRSCPVPYRDRPEGSTSKLSTYRDGFKVLKTIFRMYRDYRPFKVFGIAACFLALLSLVLFVPVFGEYLVTGLVPRLPTLIVSGLSMSMAMLSFCAGLIMERIYLGQRQNLEILLNMLHMELKQHTSTAATDSLESV